jgi:hypothetical protein
MNKSEEQANIPMTGALMCFCRKDGSGYGALYKQLDKKYNYTSLDKKAHQNVKICKPYSSDYFKEKFLNRWIKNLIIFINTAIRMVVIKIIHFIGCSTES